MLRRHLIELICINLFYTNHKSIIRVNGHCSDLFNVEGCEAGQINVTACFRTQYWTLSRGYTPKYKDSRKSGYGRVNILNSPFCGWHLAFYKTLTPLILFGRVETIRMNLLPWLLLLFQSLPVGIPTSIFNMLNKLISTFIW